jgi:5-methyltetrahydropteroyltriglutamate--homocysteine methyltransferase
LGLVTTKKGRPESIDVLRTRVAQASRYMDRNRLGISPQCGFASSVMGNTVTALEQKGKLELVVRAAAELWN